MLETQKEVFAICEHANRNWLERNRAVLATDRKDCRFQINPGRGERVSRMDGGKHIKQLAANGESLVANSQKLAKMPPLKSGASHCRWTADGSHSSEIPLGKAMRTIRLDQAVEMIPNGSNLMIGGFIAVGTPEPIIDELVRQGKKALTAPHLSAC